MGLHVISQKHLLICSFSPQGARTVGGIQAMSFPFSNAQDYYQRASAVVFVRTGILK